MEEQLINLSFVVLGEVEDGVLRGGILVTDSRGKPVEFRCTSPIRPLPYNVRSMATRSCRT